MIKIGIVGYGYWGPNLLRNFFELPKCQIKKVADLNPQALTKARKYYPSIVTTTNADEILEDEEIDAVIIATPVSTHFLLAKKALECDKHVLVEKPMTKSLKEAAELVNLAEKKGKILMIDHTFLYTDAVQKIKKLIDAGEAGKIKYFDSIRTNLGLFQQDVNVLWDLASHDVSIVSYLIKEQPQTIQASGVSHTKNKVENIAFLTIKYRSGLIAHFDCSWSSPVKIRLILIGGTKKMIVYNDVEPTEKIKVYDTNYKFRLGKDKTKLIVDYRVGDIHIPKIELKEALTNVALDFVNAIVSGQKPIANAQLGLAVVKVLSLAEQSLRRGKQMIYEKN